MRFNLSSDTLAEWLRRRPAKPMGSPRAGSNPAGVALDKQHIMVYALTTGQQHPR